VDGSTKIAACFDREKDTRFCVRFDTKQQTGGSNGEPPVFDHPVINLCRIARHFRTADDQKRSICAKSPAALAQP
jgi:hypothetical protein